jgi:beta-lactamase class A
VRCSSALPPGARQPPKPQHGFRLESRFDARLGLYAVDVGTGAEVSWRADERFAYTSTIKALAAADLLDTVGVGGLEQQVLVEQEDILPYSPVTEQHVGRSMTLGKIAEAAVTRSDNAAGNYLFDAVGGPEELDEALEQIGDDVTTVSRIEPSLNEATPGDERDTTTPRAIAGSLREYVFGDTLTSAEERVLTGWLTSTQTGDTLVRAQLPEDWTVGDKSGAGGYGTRSDIAVVWPDEGDPLVIAVMSSRDEQQADFDDELVAQATATALEAIR